MKREDLKALGLADELIDKIMAENGKDIEATKAKFSDYETTKTQLADATKTIDGFKAMDIEGVKKAADDWKAKAEKAEADAAAKITDMQFDGLLTSTVSAAKGKSAKAIRALLNVDTLKSSKNQEADIKTALEALKKESGYLFEQEQTPPPYAGGTGTNPVNAKYTPEVNAIRAAAGLKTE